MSLCFCCEYLFCMFKVGLLNLTRLAHIDVDVLCDNCMVLLAIGMCHCFGSFSCPQCEVQCNWCKLSTCHVCYEFEQEAACRQHYVRWSKIFELFVKSREVKNDIF